MTYDPTQVKLGKQDHRADPRTLQLAHYIDAKALPPAPTHLTRDPAVRAWPMYGNDRYGDCVFAEMGHHVQLLTAEAGHEVDVTDADVLGVYHRVTGFDPVTGANDNGAVILDALNSWRHDGIAGHKIGAFAEVDIHNHALIRDAVFLLGGLSIGLALPVAAQSMGQHWVRPRGRLVGANEPGSWGGHCVFVVDYDRYGVTVVTWGELTKVSWGFWDAYCDEAWAPLSADWFAANGKAVNGFDTAALQADLGQLGRVH